MSVQASDGNRQRRRLGIVGALVAVIWVGLAATADANARARHAAALAGELMRLAHQLAGELRDAGPAAAPAALAAALAGHPELLAGAALLDAGDGVESGVGFVVGPGALTEEVLLGPAWAGGRRQRGQGWGLGPGEQLGLGPPGGGPPGGNSVVSAPARGRRSLRLVPTAARLQRPLSERILLPMAVALAMILFGAALALGRALDRERRLAQSRSEQARLESLGRAGAGLAHQLRTPLATIKGRTQLLLDELGAPPLGLPSVASGAAGSPAAVLPGGALGAGLRQILEQAVRMERQVNRLLDFARPPAAERVRVDLRTIGDELAMAYPQLEVSVLDCGPVLVDPEHLREILDNLIANARQMSAEGGAVELTTAAGRGGSLVVTVADRGPGPGEPPERLFEPYVTSRADGTGLGLPIARALARANGGELTLAARPGGGTLACLVLERVRR